jgi:hypothetical protein
VEDHRAELEEYSRNKSRERWSRAKMWVVLLCASALAVLADPPSYLLQAQGVSVSPPVPLHDALSVAFSRVEQLYKFALPATPTFTPTPTPTPTPTYVITATPTPIGRWGIVEFGKLPIVTRDVSDDGTLPAGGAYEDLQAQAEGLNLGYNHR